MKAMKAMRVSAPEREEPHLGCPSCGILSLRGEPPQECITCGKPLVPVTMSYSPELLRSLAGVIAEAAVERMLKEDIGLHNNPREPGQTVIGHAFVPSRKAPHRCAVPGCGWLKENH